VRHEHGSMRCYLTRAPALANEQTSHSFLLALVFWRCKDVQQPG
jgi:hypothetical protein